MTVAPAVKIEADEPPRPSRFPLRRYLGDLLLAADNLRAQKTRTFLTALGIVFGVGSVIGMLAIGAGAREESLRFIEQLGVRNVLIDSRPAASQEELQQRRRASPGLAERDVRIRSEEHTSELQSRQYLVCRLLLEKKKK